MNLTSPKQWKTHSIYSLAQWVNGLAFKAEDFSKKGVGLPVIKINELKSSVNDQTAYTEKEFDPKYLLQKGDMLFSWSGSPETSIDIYWYDFINGWLNQHIFKVIPDSKLVDKNFFYFLLKSQKPMFIHLAKQRQTTGLGHVTVSDLKELQVSIPELLDDQREIAAILGSLDDKIELLRRENKTLESIAQGLFREWFVEFRFPGYEGVKVEDEVPEGWKAGKLTDIAEFLNGVASQKYPVENKNESLPVIKIREMKSGITADTDRATSKIDPDYIVKSGDMLFSWSGSLDIVLWNDVDGVLNQHLFKVTSENYPKWFYYYWVLQHLPEFKSIAESKATTMGHIQRHHLDDAEVLIPDKKTFGIMSDLMNPLLNKQILNNSEIRNLSKMRDELLNKIFLN